MEEHIRDPDTPFYDRLIDAPPQEFSFEDDLEYTIQQSKLEYETEQTRILRELEEKERVERRQKFDNVKKICRRLIAVSEKDRPTLELFLYFIQLYETDYISHLDTEPKFYNELFTILKSTRISSQDMDLCKNFIILKNT